MSKSNHPMDVFARNKKSGHPGWIYEKRGNYYAHIDITHSNKSGKNIPLKDNPEPGNDSQAYIKPRPEKSRKEDFKEKYTNWHFSDRDMQTVKNVKKKPFKKNGK